MPAPIQSKNRFSSLVLVLAASLVACAAPERKPQPGPSGSLELLAELQPGDIVVAPVRNQTKHDSVPLDALRQGLSDAIVSRMYNPLDLAYVDKNWIESSFRGSPAPDALLVMAVTSWDASHLYSSGDVSMTAELLLFSGGSTTGQALWGKQITHTVNMRGNSKYPPAPSPLLLVEASRQLTEFALSSLPMRDPVAAHESKL